MTTFKEIRGTAIRVVSTDPTNPETGQIWYNSSSGTLKGFVFATAGIHPVYIKEIKEEKGEVSKFIETLKKEATERSHVTNLSQSGSQQFLINVNLASKGFCYRL